MKITLSLLVILLLFNGCQVKTELNENDDYRVSLSEKEAEFTEPQTDSTSYLNRSEAREELIISESSFQFQDQFTIKYPVVAGKSDFTEMNNSIRNLIEQRLLDSFGEYSSLERFELDYSADVVDGKYLNICFDGVSYVKKAAYPTLNRFTFVIDLTNGRPMSIQKFVTLDPEFLNSFRIAWKQQVISELHTYLDDTTDEELISQIQKSAFTVSDTDIKIFYSVPKAAGFFAEITVVPKKTD